MMSPVKTCLWYDGVAEDAARFYCSLVKDSGVDGVTHQVAADGSRSVLTVDFHLGSQEFVALNGGPDFRFTEATSVQVHCVDQSEVDHLWAGLAEGGSQGMCGWLKDRYGLSWQIIPDGLHELLSDPDPGRAHRATAAMLTMHRLDLAVIRAAADRAAS